MDCHLLAPLGSGSQCNRLDSERLYGHLATWGRRLAQRVTRSEDDVKAHARGLNEGRATAPAGLAQTPLPDFGKWGDIEIEPPHTFRRQLREGRILELSGALRLALECLSRQQDRPLCVCACAVRVQQP